MKLEDLEYATVLRNYRRNAMLLLKSVQSGFLDLRHPLTEVLTDCATVHTVTFTGLVPIDNVRAAAVADLEVFIAEQEEKLRVLGVTLSNTEE